MFTPDATSTGVFAPGVHTNTTTECFGVAGAGLPNTGFPISARDMTDIAPAGIAVVPLLLLMVSLRRRGAAFAVVLALAVAAGAVPDSAQPHRMSRPAAAFNQPATAVAPQTVATPGIEQSGTRTVWRLVIEKIGVDAPIERVGLDPTHAMASPSSLADVGWFEHGPSPGQPGDAVIDGHYGLPSNPAVFRNLRELAPGDALLVIWPDGRQVRFRVTSSVVIARNAPAPPGLFGAGGASRLSLITCAGAWDQANATYTQRLIVTAVRVT